MRRLLFLFALLLFTSTVFSQTVFNLGLKAGVHTSKLSLNEEGLFSQSGLNLNSESITKTHWGAFGRIGYGRLFVQPEVYFSKKGSEFSSNILDAAGDFDYNNVDVPLLFGYKIIKKETVDLHVIVGPVFSFVTDADYPEELDAYLKDEFLDDHLFGVQYGLGIDVLFLTIDARVEHGSKIYNDPNFVSSKSTTYMFTVGFKIL